jgi:hypothetical protein
MQNPAASPIAAFKSVTGNKCNIVQSDQMSALRCAALNRTLLMNDE